MCCRVHILLRLASGLGLVVARDLSLVWDFLHCLRPTGVEGSRLGSIPFRVGGGGYKPILTVIITVLSKLRREKRNHGYGV